MRNWSAAALDHGTSYKYDTVSKVGRSFIAAKASENRRARRTINSWTRLRSHPG